MQGSRKYISRPYRYLTDEQFIQYLFLVKKIASFDPDTRQWYINPDKVMKLSREELDSVVDKLVPLVPGITEALEEVFKVDGVRVHGNYVYISSSLLDAEKVLKLRTLTTYYKETYDRDLHMRREIPVRLFYDGGNVIATWRGFIKRLVDNNVISVPQDFYEDFNVEPVPLERYEPRDYQVNAVKEWLKSVNLQGAGLIQSPTGTGKSVMAVMAIKSFLRKYQNARILYITLNTTLLKQFQDFLRREGFSSGLVASGVFDVDEQVVNVSVMTLYKALQKVGKEVEKIEKGETDEDTNLDFVELDDPKAKRLVDLLAEAKLIIVDEAHHVPASSIKSILKYAEDSVRLGMTATPWRDAGDDLVIYSLLGDPVVRYRLMDFVTRGVLTPPLVKFVRIGDYKSFSEYNKEKRYQFEDDRNYDEIVGIIERAEKPALVLVKEKVQLQKLKERLGGAAAYLSGEDNIERRYEIIERFNEGQIPILVATPIFDEGIDIPSIRSLVLLTQGRSKVKYLQRIGRSLRRANGKDRVVIYDVVYNSRYFINHMKGRINVLEEEKIPYET